FLLNSLQVVAATKAFRVQLVDRLCSGGTRREPAICGDHLQTADGCTVSWCGREHRLDRVTGKLGCRDVFWRELEQHGLLFRGGWRIDTGIHGSAQLMRQVGVQLGWISPGLRHDFNGEQIHDDAVLLGHPYCSVTPQERSARALFASEAQRSVEQTGDEPLE